MRRRLLLAFVPTIVAAVLAAAPAAGRVPGGQGLVLELGVTCEGGASMSVLVTPGASAWFPSTGDHIVLKSFSGTITFTPEGGGTPIVDSFTKTYGQKAGLGDSTTCTQSFTETIPGEGTVTGSITAEVLVVPPDG
jgi:hypothetical protein